MTRYRIYLLGIDGVFIDSIEMNCDDDATAITDMGHYASQAPNLELWNGERLVGRTNAAELVGSSLGALC